MRILVLFDVHRPIGPDETFSVSSLRGAEEKPTEADVLACLRKLGHEVETLAVYDAVKAVLDKIEAFKPDVVFNLCETFFSDRANEPNIPALLELMKVPYTGAGPDALMLCKDKALAKKLLSFHRIRVARFVVSARERPLRHLRRFAYPAFERRSRKTRKRPSTARAFCTSASRAMHSSRSTSTAASSTWECSATRG
jgi:D-alanine-D-alanine ligase